ncbi:hypothetical protein Gotur_017712, partial [Gossypium turneri]
MLSAVEERVGKLEESMEDAKELGNALGESIDDLREQSRDFVTTCLTFQRDNVRELLDSQRKKLTERNDTLEAMMMALKEETMATTRALSTRIEELEGELALCRAAVGKGVSSAALSNEDVPKPKEFVGTRSACDVDNFLITQWGTVGEYVREFKELMLQVSEVTEREALLAFQNGLKLWVRQEVEQRGVQKLSEAMTVVESVVKLGLGKVKLGSSKSEERGVCEIDHKEDIVEGNGNGNNGGNEKPRVGKKKPKRKRDKLKCFLCDAPHMLKKCPRKSALKEKPVVKALVLGSSAKGVEAKVAESEKKPVECFLCHGRHRLQKYPRKSVIEGNDGANKEPKKLVKLGPMRLKLSEASELAESSTRLP